MCTALLQVFTEFDKVALGGIHVFWTEIVILLVFFCC